MSAKCWCCRSSNTMSSVGAFNRCLHCGEYSAMGLVNGQPQPYVGADVPSNRPASQAQIEFVIANPGKTMSVVRTRLTEPRLVIEPDDEDGAEGRSYVTQVERWTFPPNAYAEANPGLPHGEGED